MILGRNTYLQGYRMETEEILRKTFFFSLDPLIGISMEKNNILKIVPDNSPRSEELMKGEPHDYRESSYWYLHGRLENMVGYDKARIYEGLRMSNFRSSIDWTEIYGNQVTRVRSQELRLFLRLQGEFRVEVLGIPEPAIGFFWVTDERVIEYGGIAFIDWKQRGLVVLESDTKALEEARKSYEQKSVTL